jgi:hypothetical protein
LTFLVRTSRDGICSRHCNNCGRQNSLKNTAEHISYGTWNFEQGSGVIIDAPKTDQKLPGRILYALEVQISK